MYIYIFIYVCTYVSECNTFYSKLHNMRILLQLINLKELKLINGYLLSLNKKNIAIK